MVVIKQLNNKILVELIKSIKNIDNDLKLNESANTKLAKFEELSKNIIKEKQVVKENTRLSQEFIDSMVKMTSNQLKKKIFESYENSDVVKLLKEVILYLINSFNIS